MENQQKSRWTTAKYRRYQKKYRKTHAEALRKYQREYKKEYRQAHPEKVREYEREYRRQYRAKKKAEKQAQASQIGGAVNV